MLTTFAVPPFPHLWSRNEEVYGDLEPSDQRTEQRKRGCRTKDGQIQPRCAGLGRSGYNIKGEKKLSRATEKKAPLGILSRNARVGKRKAGPSPHPQEGLGTGGRRMRTS